MMRSHERAFALVAVLTLAAGCTTTGAATGVAASAPPSGPAGVSFGDMQDPAPTGGDSQAAADSDLGETAGDLAKKTQNPVADLISVPLQNNFLFNVGHKRKTAYVLNIQPVIPVHLNEDWNLITRTILPVIDQPEIVPGFGDESGLGDLDFTAFLSPAKPGSWIFGLGPTISLPTATDDALGSDRWGLGPSAVALTMDGPWVYGALIKNQWDVGGDGDRKKINRGLLQPFVNYNMAGGWYLVSSPIITANWRVDQSDRWTVPMGGGFGRLFRIGEQPVNAQIQAFYNVLHADLGGNWSLRLQIQFLF